MLAAQQKPSTSDVPVSQETSSELGELSGISEIFNDGNLNLSTNVNDFIGKDLVGDLLKAPHTKVGSNTFVANKKVGEVLKIDGQNRTFTRAPLKLTHSYSIGEKAQATTFTITPNGKYSMWGDVLNHLSPLFAALAGFNNYYTDLMQTYADFPTKSLTAMNSSVDVRSESTTGFRYYASRAIRTVRKYMNAFYGEAERYWTSAEAIVKSKGFTPLIKGSVTSKNSILRDFARIERNREMTTPKTTNSMNQLEVRGKKATQFSSLLYVTPQDLQHTQRKLACIARHVKDTNGLYVEQNIDGGVFDVVRIWYEFERLNKLQAARVGSMHIADVPFYVIDAVGIWDISKSMERPNLKPISVSSVLGMRMPFIHGTRNNQGIDGNSVDYVKTSQLIDVAIVSLKTNAYGNQRRIIEDIGHELMGPAYHVKNVKLVKGVSLERTQTQQASTTK